MTENRVLNPVWPPPQRTKLFRNMIAWGALVGSIEGVAVGAFWGLRVDDLAFSCLSGWFIGLFDGGLATWAFSRLRHPCKARFGLRLLPVLCWLIGAWLIGLSAVALVEFRDSNEFWSPPLAVLGLPIGGVFPRTIVEAILTENRYQFIELPDLAPNRGDRPVHGVDARLSGERKLRHREHRNDDRRLL